MDPAALVSKLTALAETLDIEVRFEGTDSSRGGLFALRGKQTLLVNEALPDEEKAAVMAEALSGFDLDNVYVLPEVRAAIEASPRERT